MRDTVDWLIGAFIFCLIAAVCIGVLVVAVDGTFGGDVVLGRATVIGKGYESSQTHVIPAGKTVVITSEPEKWLVIVRHNGNVIPATAEHSAAWEAISGSCELYQYQGVFFSYEYKVR